MPRPTSPEIMDLLALSLVPGLGPKLTAALLNHFGSAAAVRKASAADLRKVPMIGPKLSEAFAAALASAALEEECSLLDRFNVNVIPRGVDAYPSSLAQIGDSPAMLYVRGLIAPADQRAVAIVGSRNSTSYGRKMAQQLASGLGRAGVTVVSGLARGIDGVAHEAALKAGGRTLAVLAGGLSRIYPREHTELANDIESAGAIISEAPMKTEPLPTMFPSRNRIISGLSMAVIVVEASEQSGTLITARHAAEQSREVLAVPGPVDSPNSAGCHRLIRDGATLIRDVDDVLEAINRSFSPPAEFRSGSTRKASAETAPPGQAASPPPDLDEVSRRVWDFLADGPRAMDTVAQELQVGIPELSRTMMMLEMKKLVRRMPGNIYERR